jgi:hypothetical protein
MTWSKKKIDRIPEVYRDFMLSLKPVVDCRRRPDEYPIKVTGVHLGQIFNILRMRHQLNPEEIREIATTVRQKGLVEENKLGFIKPTAKGEGLIDALVEAEAPVASRVPPFPDF